MDTLTTVKREICVFCGVGFGLNPAYAEAARALGSELASRDAGLVYGGGSNGLMGEVARAVKAAGGHVTGIIPEFLGAKERMFTDVNELIVTTTMHERKMTMFERSDGFVALPGGIGTLEELTEIATWAQLDQHTKPIMLCNIEELLGAAAGALQHMREEEFIRAGMDFKLDIVTRVGRCGCKSAGAPAHRASERAAQAASAADVEFDERLVSPALPRSASIGRDQAYPHQREREQASTCPWARENKDRGQEDQGRRDILQKPGGRIAQPLDAGGEEHQRGGGKQAEPISNKVSAAPVRNAVVRDRCPEIA